MSPDERQEFHLALEGPDGYAGAKCVVCGKHRHPEDIAFNSDTGPACVDCNYDSRAPPPKKRGRPKGSKTKKQTRGKAHIISDIGKISKQTTAEIKALTIGRPTPLSTLN